MVSLHFEMWDPFNTEIEFILTKSTIMIYFVTLLPEIRVFLSLKGINKFLYPITAYFIILTFVSYLNINRQSNIYFSFPLFLNIIIFLLITNHFKRDPYLINKALSAFVVGGILLTIFYFLGIDIETSPE